MLAENSGNNPIITKTVTRSKTQKGKLLNQYLKIKRIGQGPFSKIKLMLDTKTNTHYAMKKYNMFILRKKIKMGSRIGGQTQYTNQAEQVNREIEVMRRLDHRNVVRLREVIYDEEQQKVYLFMDYCKYGDVAQWNHKTQKFTCKWSYKMIAKFFKQACAGLAYLHELDIVHRDLKPQNILIHEDQSAKLIDFGRSVQLTTAQQRLVGSEGTYHFMSPQMLEEKTPGGYDGKLCDVWSLGVALFCVVFGRLPFDHDLLINLFEIIDKVQYEFPQNMTPEQQKFVNIIRRILVANWLQRPTLAQIHAQLQKIQNQL